MTTIQLKAEIHKVIDTVPDSVLPDVLKYLISTRRQYPDTSDLDEFIDRVFTEDDGLLRRLAE